MLPRTNSIFHLGEDHHGEIEEAASKNTRIMATRALRSPESLVGLRILIQQQGRGISNVVIKSAMRSGRPNGQSCAVPKSLPELGFLKTCFFCRRELSLQKDIYMYRGDQGFCSVECRGQQILLDERRELESSMMGQLRVQHHHRRSSTRIRDADRRRRITIAT